MIQALGLAAMIVVVAIFMPRVLDAIQAFLLAFFKAATNLINGLGNAEKLQSFQALMR